MTQESCHKSRKHPLKSRRVVIELDTDEKVTPIHEREEENSEGDEDNEERCDTENRWNQCGAEDRVTNTSVLDDI
jgi:hypothetical protein